MAKDQDFSREEALAEAYKRGILPPDMKDAYEEAQRRGLVGGAPASSASPAEDEDFDIDSLIDEAVGQIPGGYENWKKRQGHSYGPVTANGVKSDYNEDGSVDVPGIGRTAPRDPTAVSKAPFMAQNPNPQLPKKKPQQAPIRGDRAEAFYDTLSETGVRGDLVGRAAGSAVNSIAGAVDLFSEPGRWMDDAAGSVAPWWPSLVWDDQGMRLETAEGLDDAEKEYGGLPRIPMDAPSNDAEAAADMIGEGIGFIAPGALVHKGVAKAGQAASKLPGVAGAVAAITPKGADAAARAGRYGQRILSTVPESAVQAGVFGASTAKPERSIIDEETGVTSTMPAEDPGERAGQFMTNPLSYLAPAALSGIYRSAIGLKTGGARVTPLAVQRSVAPHMLSATDEAVAALGDLPIPAGIKDTDADKALGIMHRALKGGGVPDDIMAAEVKAYNELKGDRPAPAVWLRSRLSAYPKAIENLDNAIYEIGQKSPEVGAALRDMRTTQAQRLKDGLRDTLGKGDRVKRDAKLKGDLEDMGEEMYEPILAAGAVDDEAANTLRALLNDTEFASEIPVGYRTKLSMAAINMAPEAPPTSGLPAKPGQTAAPHQQTGPDLMGGDPMRKALALQQRIQENPLEVAHKLYSSLGQRIRNAKGADTSKIRELRDTIRPHLFKAGGTAYRDANSAYLKTASARRALSRPDKLFSEALKSHEVARVKADYKAMKTAEKESYKVSLKGLLDDELRRASANNDFVALGRMKREGVLDAIEEILDVGSSTKGTDTAAQIRNILDEQDQIASADPAVKTNRSDRMASGREAYAGKTGALEHTGRYDLNSLAQDVAVSAGANLVLPGSSAVIPIRAIIRLAQKGAAAAATPSRAARGSFSRIALERPGVSTQVSARVAAARARRQAAAQSMYRTKNGKFGGKAHIMDPEAPGRPPFDDEGFAASMSDDGTPKIPGGGGSVVDDELSIIDEGYAAPPPNKRLPGKPKMIGSDRPATAGVKGEEKQQQPQTAAERYVETLLGKRKRAEEELDEVTRQKTVERGKRREDERMAADAERLRAQEDDIRNQTRSEGLKVERERERALAAQERARKAAEDAEAEMNVGEPTNTSDGPFSRLGRMRDRQTAKPGDPRSMRDVMKYIVGDEEPAALSNNLRRFGRDQNFEWYNAPSINRVNEIMRAAKGQKEGISPEVLDMVGKLNKANREWLGKQLEEPQNFDILDMLQQIDELPARGNLELQYGSTGPLAAGGAGFMAAALGGKAIYDARERRTPEQIETDRKKLYGDQETDGFEAPDNVEVRQMQAALNKLGYKDRFGKELTVDGVAGDRFREAVLEFASANGLTPNGLNKGGLSTAIVEKMRKYYQ